MAAGQKNRENEKFRKTIINDQGILDTGSTGLVFLMIEVNCFLLAGVLYSVSGTCIPCVRVSHKEHLAL